MADASDSKSDEGDFVRVQVPPSALNKNAGTSVDLKIYRGFFTPFQQKGANFISIS